MNGRDMFEADSNSASYNPSHMSSEWRFWGDNRVDPLINVQNQLDYSISTNGEQAGFGGIDVIASGSNSNLMAMIPLKPMLKEAQVLPNAPGIVPSELPQLPADSGFIGRPAWFSSFSDENLGVMMNTPLAISESMSLCSGDGNVIQGPQDAFLQAWPMQSYKNDRNFDKNSRGLCPGMESTGSEVYWIKNKERISVYAKSDEETKQHGLATGNEPDDNEFTDVNGPEETSNVKAKNRKRICQGVESGFLNVAEENSEAVKDAAEEKEKNEPNLKSTAADKSAGKQEQPGPEASNSPSAEYIHVRARRGQATNSHSLAERVRREKISDRMKLLQDIVPGCNKVSGKAVMLDEIINYVQSLQHQVEFLSMKLATVNPCLNNTETLHLQPGSSSRPGIFQVLPMPQPVFFNPNFNSTPCFRLRSINPQLTSLNQPSVWEDELGNVAHMTGGVTHYRHTKTHTDLRHLGT